MLNQVRSKVLTCVRMAAVILLAGGVTAMAGSAPSVPSGVSAVAGDGSITISWNAVNGAGSYNVHYDEDPSSPPYDPNTVANEGPSPISTTSTSLVLTGLPNGTTFYLAVTAVKGSCEHGYSAQVTATPVAPRPSVVINEIDPACSDWVELHNPESFDADLTGWTLGMAGPCGSSVYTFPTGFTLPAGGYVVVRECSGSDTATNLYTSANIWFLDREGHCALKDGANDGVDFVRWGTSTQPPPAGTSWTGTISAGPASGKTLGRDGSSTDTDDASDWEPTCGVDADSPTPGAANVTAVVPAPPPPPPPAPAPASITVTSPNGGETWRVGETHDITWTAVGFAGDVWVFYSLDGGSTNANCTYVFLATVPVSDGSYTWTIPDRESTRCRVRVQEATGVVGGGLGDESDADFTITSAPVPSPAPSGVASLVYVYDSDAAAAGEFESTLTGFGYAVTLLRIQDVDQFDFAPHDAIIAGNDTGYLGSWGNAAAVDAISSSAKPVIGIGEGGYALFGRLSLDIGYPWGWHGSQTSIHVVDGGHEIFNHPNPLSLTTGDVLSVYGSTGHVGIYLPSIPAAVQVLGREANNTTHYPLVKQGDCLLWGFTGSPAVMTGDGIALFENALAYVISATQPSGGGSPPPPAAPAAGAHVLVNEVFPGATDWVELHNTGNAPADLTGWTLSVETDCYGARAAYTFPAGFVLGAGGYVVVREQSGTDTATELYTGFTIFWYDCGAHGSVILRDATGSAADFVRWGSSSVAAPAGTAWSGANPSGPASGQSVGRDGSSTDTDAGSDWEHTGGVEADSPTPGAANVTAPSAPPSGAGIAPDAYEPDDVIAQAGVILDGEIQVRSIHVAGNLDHATFFLSETSDVVIETDGSAGDTGLYLYDHAGSLIAYNDDGGSGYFSRILVTALVPGDYYIRIEEYGNNGTIEVYTLSLTTDLAPAAAPVVTPPASSQSVVINEIDPACSDWVELHNPESFGVDLTGWTLGMAGPCGWSVYTFPTGFTLPAGGYVVVRECSGSDTATNLYTGTNIWFLDREGHCALKDGANDGVDFVRWGTSVQSPLGGTSWTGTVSAGPVSGKTLGRDGSSTDTDDASDWENTCGVDAGSPTPGAANGTAPTAPSAPPSGAGIAPDAYEPDDSLAQAGVILDGEIQVRSIHVAGDLDHATFFLSETRDVVIETDGPVGDTVLYLYDASGYQIAYNDDGGSGYFSRIRVTALAPGDYYMKIEDCGNNGTIEVYTLSLTTDLPPAPAPAPAPATGPISQGSPEPHFEDDDTPGYFWGCSPRAGRVGASGRRELPAWLLPLAATLLAVAALRRRRTRRAVQARTITCGSRGRE